MKRAYWWVLGALGIGGAIVLGGKKVYDKVQLAKMEGDAADKYGFPRWWFIALGLQETGLDPTKVNMTGGDKARGGSWGLNQISLLTARKHGFTGQPEELLDPKVNTDLTGHIFSAPKDRWDRVRNPPRSFTEAASMWNGGYYPGDEDSPPPGGKPVSDQARTMVANYIKNASGYGGMAERLS